MRCSAHTISLCVKEYYVISNMENRLKLSSLAHNNFTYDICETKWGFLERTMQSLPEVAKIDFINDIPVIKLVSNLLTII